MLYLASSIATNAVRIYVGQLLLGRVLTFQCAIVSGCLRLLLPS